MKLSEIYELAIKMGIENDLRGPNAAKQDLAAARADFNKLDKEKQKEFDQTSLINPYLDSRLEFGNPDQQIKKVLTGIDMDPAEVLLADRLGDIDAIIAHHPVGRSLNSLDDVMHIQAGIYAKYGVPINIAEGVLNERISEVERKLHPNNTYQPIDIARSINMPFLVTHTVCDNMAATFMQNLMDKEAPQTVGQVLDVIMSLPEYQLSKQRGIEPMLFSGSEKNSAGKVVVTEFTGGTEGSSMIYERMAHVGIGTIISMHASENARKEAQKHHINMVVAGHMASDSLGMNILLDQLEKRGVQIVAVSGLLRVSRNKNSTKSKRK